MFPDEDAYETLLYEYADAWFAACGRTPPTPAWSHAAYARMGELLDPDALDRHPWEGFHADLTEEIAVMAARKNPTQP